MKLENYKAQRCTLAQKRHLYDRKAYLNRYNWLLLTFEHSASTQTCVHRRLHNFQLKLHFWQKSTHFSIFIHFNLGVCNSQILELKPRNSPQNHQKINFLPLFEPKSKRLSKARVRMQNYDLPSPFATSLFAKSVFAKSLAKRSTGAGAA